jgi:hypothetical protein
MEFSVLVKEGGYLESLISTLSFSKQNYTETLKYLALLFPLQETFTENILTILMENFTIKTM